MIIWNIFLIIWNIFADAVRPDVYADTTAIELTRNGSETVCINRDLDTIATPTESAGYAARVRERGDVATKLLLPGGSHFDEVAITSPS